MLLGLGLLHLARGTVLLHPGALPVEEFMQRPSRLPCPELFGMRRELGLPIRMLSQQGMHTQGHVRGRFRRFPHEDVPSDALGSHSSPRCLLLEREAAEQDEEAAREEHES